MLRLCLLYLMKSICFWWYPIQQGMARNPQLLTDISSLLFQIFAFYVPLRSQ
jgi:hypothetical protein